MSTPEENIEAFDGYIQKGEYGPALTLATLPEFPEDILRKTIADLLAITNNIEEELKTRLNSFIVARCFFWKRESFKKDAKLQHELFKSEFAVQAPLSFYF
jgi:hypothetical protein